jgi:hypothetical protein
MAQTEEAETRFSNEWARRSRLAHQRQHKNAGRYRGGRRLLTRS